MTELAFWKRNGKKAEDQNTQTNGSKDCSFVDVFVSVLGWYNNMQMLGIDSKTPQIVIVLETNDKTIKRNKLLFCNQLAPKASQAGL